ncbi:MAG: hypothetical protein R6V14_04520 [Halanaerobiales bacterium]
MKKSIVLLITIIFCFTTYVSADIELTGKLEKGDNTYISNESELSGEVVDYYNYDNLWIKVKKKLDYPNYYYFKTKYYQKYYDNKISYNNETIDLIGNYTQEFKEDFRNKFKVSIKDKNYFNKIDNSYTSYTLNYQFRHQLNDTNQYLFDLKRRSYNYPNDNSKNYNVDTYKFNWKRDISESLELKFGYQVQKENHFFKTGVSDKFGERYSIDFKYSFQ